MLTCREVTELCSRELEQPIGLRERVALRAHLLVCPGCSNFRRQMRGLREAARNYARGLAATTESDAREDGH